MERPASQDLTQAFTGILNTPALNTIYDGMIDATFNSFARDVVLYLEPARSLPAGNAATYNPMFGSAGQDPRLDQSTDNTGNKGVIVTPITVTYKGHIKHGPWYLNENTPFKLNEDEVAVTTVYESLNDINKSIEILIDGQLYVKEKGARPVGFSSPKYIISTWIRKPNPGMA